MSDQFFADFKGTAADISLPAKVQGDLAPDSLNYYRGYVRSLPRLTEEEERVAVERLEDARANILRILCGNSVSLEKLIAIYDGIAGGFLRAKDFVVSLPDVNDDGDAHAVGANNMTSFKLRTMEAEIIARDIARVGRTFLAGLVENNGVGNDAQEELVNKIRTMPLFDSCLAGLIEDVATENREENLHLDYLLVGLKKWQRRLAQAKERLVTAHLYLVLDLVGKFRKVPMAAMDLVQEGNIGLMYAAEKFEKRRGYSFQNCAHPWVIQHMFRAVADKGSVIRVPVHVYSLKNVVNNVRLDLSRRLGRDATAAEVAKKLGKSVKQVEDVLNVVEQPVSLTVLQKDSDNDMEFTGYVADPDAKSPEDEAVANCMARAARSMLSVLTPREERVIRMRFGIGSNNDLTLQDIGDAMGGVTRERVRQLEARAMRKLKTSPVYPVLATAMGLNT